MKIKKKRTGKAQYLIYGPAYKYHYTFNVIVYNQKLFRQSNYTYEIASVKLLRWNIN